VKGFLIIIFIIVNNSFCTVMAVMCCFAVKKQTNNLENILSSMAL